MYRKRPFDVVTVSINTPDERSGVLSLLKEQHAGTRNLLIDFNDPADGIAAFGTDWAGGVPYTVLISPEGEVLYRIRAPSTRLRFAAPSSSTSPTTTISAPTPTGTACFKEESP